MKENKICKVVQDLLPNYNEKLTNFETNQYIEEHLNECDECKQILKYMKEELTETKEKQKKKEVKYMKKINKKIRLLKFIILLTFLTILLFFTVIIGRRMMIISNISKKAEQYIDSNNYHVTIYSYYECKFYKYEVYILENKIKIISDEITENGSSHNITIGYKNLENNNPDYEEYITNDYMEDKEGKIVLMNCKLFGRPKPENKFVTKNIWELFKISLDTSIKETELDGKKCYRIENKQKQLKNLYIDMNTGLEVYSSESENNILEIQYEFNTVTDNDFVKPDLSQYQVMTTDEYVQRKN